MKKSLTLQSFDLSVFAKSQLSELSTIQGGTSDATHTAPEDTTSSSDDADSNSTDSDGGVIIVAS